MSLIMTEKGRGLVAEAMTEEVAIQFTKLVTSDTIYDQDEVAMLEQIVNPKQEVAITEVEKTDETTVTVAVTMDNMDLTEGYYIRCIGVYAKGSSNKEILFGVAIVEENPDYMPMFVGQTVSGIEYKFYINVGNAENVLIEVNPDNFVTFEKYDKLEATVDGLKENVGELEATVDGLQETVDGLSESVQNELSTTLDGKYDKTGGEISGKVTVGGALTVNGGQIYSVYGFTTPTIEINKTSSGMYATTGKPQTQYSFFSTPYALRIESSVNTYTDSSYDASQQVPVHILAGSKSGGLDEGLLVYGDKIIYNNEELATKSDVTSGGTTVINNLTSTSTTSALSAYQGKVLNEAITSNKVSVVNGLTSTSTTSALSAYQGKVLSDKVSANSSCAELKGGTYAMICGFGNTATGDYASGVGYNNIASENHATSVGSNNIANGSSSTAIGYNNKAYTNYSLGVGSNNTIEGYAAVAVGMSNTVSENNGKSFGSSNNVSGYLSTAVGSNNSITEQYSFAGGYNNTTSGNASLALGSQNTASGDLSSAIGYYVTSSTDYCTVIGTYNNEGTGSANSFVVGIGYSANVKKNGLRITSTGAVYGGTYNSSGADYAEYFEWLDGNPSDEDRIGRFVTIRQGKIQLANADDTYIVGVISGNGSIIGDAQEDEWSGRFEKDIFGRVICEWQDVEHIETELVEDENGEMVEVEKTVIRNEYHMKKNPEMDNDVKYIPRSERSEWDVVGLMGKLIVIDDGTCAVDGFCSVGEEGIATDGDKYLVLERLDETHIKILKV